MFAALLRIVCIVCVLIGLLAIKKTRLRHVPARRTRVPRRYGETAVWLERLGNALLDLFHHAMYIQLSQSSPNRSAAWTPAPARRAEALPAWADSTLACVLRLWNRKAHSNTSSFHSFSLGNAPHAMPHSLMEGESSRVVPSYMPQRMRSSGTWQTLRSVWSAHTPPRESGDEAPTLFRSSNMCGRTSNRTAPPDNGRKKDTSIDVRSDSNSMHRKNMATSSSGTKGDETGKSNSTESEPMERRSAGVADVLPNRLLTAIEERVNAALEDSGLANWAQFRIFSLGEAPPRIKVIHLTSEAAPSASTQTINPVTAATTTTAVVHPLSTTMPTASSSWMTANDSSATDLSHHPRSSSSLAQSSCSMLHPQRYNSTNNDVVYNNTATTSGASNGATAMMDKVASLSSIHGTAPVSDVAAVVQESTVVGCDSGSPARREGSVHLKRTVRLADGVASAAEYRSVSTAQKSTDKLPMANMIGFGKKSSSNVNDWLGSATEMVDGALNRVSGWVMSRWTRTANIADASPMPDGQTNSVAVAAFNAHGQSKVATRLSERRHDSLEESKDRTPSQTPLSGGHAIHTQHGRRQGSSRHQQPPQYLPGSHHSPQQHPQQLHSSRAHSQTTYTTCSMKQSQQTASASQRQAIPPASNALCMYTSRLELEAEVEYSGSLDVRLQAEMSLMRGRCLPMSVRVSEVRHVRAHVHAVVTIQHVNESAAPPAHIRLSTTAPSPSLSMMTTCTAAAAAAAAASLAVSNCSNDTTKSAPKKERGVDYDIGPGDHSRDSRQGQGPSVSSGMELGVAGWCAAQQPVLHAQIWLESDPMFDMSLRTTLTRLAIRDFFLIPVVIKYILLRWVRGHLRRRGGVGGVEIVVPLPRDWLSVDTNV